MQKPGHMVLKRVNWVHIDKSRYTMKKSGHMVFKGVNWVHIDKIRSNGLERSQLGTH